MTYYYLIRPGTTLRATTLDKEPVMIQEDVLEEAIDFYDSLVGMRTLGRLQPIAVEEYHDLVEGVRTFAKLTARARAREDWEKGDGEEEDEAEDS